MLQNKICFRILAWDGGQANCDVTKLELFFMKEVDDVRKLELFMKEVGIEEEGQHMTTAQL